jgi:hypothetical protein
VDLTPTTGEPGDPVDVEGTDFAASASVGIGFGPEVDVTGELPTVTDNGEGSNPRIITGYTANKPIKPGSFFWAVNFGQAEPTEYSDNGDGTLDSNSGPAFTGTINYTTGYFTQTSTSFTSFPASDIEIDYTTYEVDVTPSGLATNSSGMLSGEITVPDIWNGTEPVTVIDDQGNVATSNFTIYGSDVVPEPLTIGAIVLLSSAALVVSFYCLRKRSYTEGVA